MNWKAVCCLGWGTKHACCRLGGGTTNELESCSLFGREGGTTRNEICKGGTRKASSLHGTGSLPHVPLGEQHSGYIPWREVPPTIVV